MSTNPHRPIRNICVVGGGTAGWMAAALMAEHFKGTMGEIEVVESDDIGTVGVGESTVPPLLQLIAKLGIDEQVFIRETQATFKLGIDFRDWRVKGERYFHPFGTIGAPVDGADFYQLWLKARANGYKGALQDFAPAAVMARERKFTLPFKAARTPIGGATYALHFDAKRVARFLRTYSEARGVKRTEGLVEDVALRADGFVETLILKDGRVVEADFFIDCSGFRSLLIGKALQTGFHDWSHWLLCDRAVALQIENTTPTSPTTMAQALDFGWRWRIPLQHRTGTGYVFSSKYLSDDEATAALMSEVEGAPVTQPWVVPFKTGVRERLWDKNVLAIGLAGGFIEPLESTAIHLIYRGMDFFFRLLPDRDCDPALAGEYNRRMITDYEEIRDFVVLHYCTTKRDDTPFWRECRDMEPPPSLKRKIDLFRVNGSLAEGLDELFRAISWQSVMEGMGIRPRTYHPLVDRVPFDGVPEQLDHAAALLERVVADLPTQEAFIARHCAAPLPETAR